MGRSQVARNRTHGRPGQGRGGRGGRGRGGGGRGGGGRSSRHKSGPDPKSLGDNSFRFAKGGGDATVGDASYDGLLDDNFISSGGAGEYYGDSHYGAEGGEEDLADATKGDTQVEDWMSIDVKALDNCLKQIPIHERLKIPRHIGRHLEEQYGVDGGGKSRKKTIAELREEAKQTSEEKDTSGGNEGGKSEQRNEDKSNNTKEEGGAEEEEDDLDAWLDDMIA